MRISNEELSKCVTGCENKPVQFSNGYYDEKGQLSDNKDDCFAKSFNLGDRMKYEVRVSRQYKQLWNHLDKSFMDEAKRQAKNMGFAKEPYVFVECNQECFSNYIEFLKTKNSGYFTKAEKELRKC